jgi:hypothetical protein
MIAVYVPGGSGMEHQLARFEPQRRPRRRSQPRQADLTISAAATIAATNLMLCLQVHDRLFPAIY